MTIWLGHLLLGMAYATVVVQARLTDLNPQLEEAAMDLGARPQQVFMAGHAADDRAEPAVGLAADLHAQPGRRGAVGLPVRPRRHHDAAGHLLARAPGPESPTINAVATVIVVMVAIGTVGASWWIARNERKRSLEMAEAARA